MIGCLRTRVRKQPIIALYFKTKHNDGCFRTRVHKQPIIALYFEFENELEFYDFEAWQVFRL